MKITKTDIPNVNVLSETATFVYKVDNYYSKESDYGIDFNDPALNIDWQINADDLHLSAKDQSHPLLADADKPFDYRKNLYG